MKHATHFWRANSRRLLTELLTIAVLAVGAAAQTSIFAVQKTPNPNVQGNTLNAVAAISPSDAWAVGYQNDNNLNQSRTLTQHWNGTNWTRMATPSPGGIDETSALLGVAAAGAHNIWAVGYYNTLVGIDKVPHTLILRWNGTRWIRS